MRTLTVEALVDTGAVTMVIPEDVARALGLSVLQMRTVTLADGTTREIAKVGGLRIEILGRQMLCDAYVTPAGSTPLIGQIPLEDLDLIVCATVTPLTMVPSNACRLQAGLGCRPIPAFDLVGACTGFLHALSVANPFIATGTYRHVMVVGTDVLTFADGLKYAAGTKLTYTVHYDFSQVAGQPTTPAPTASTTPTQPPTSNTPSPSPTQTSTSTTPVLK